MQRRRRFRKRVNRVRRRFRRRVRRGRVRPNAQIGFPTRRVVKMRYCDFVTLTLPAVASAFTEARYSANNLNDPQVALGGHQPLSYDQWAVYYNSYAVIGSRIRVQGITVSSGTAPAVIGVMLHDSSVTTSPDYQGLVEQGKSKYRFIQVAINGNVPRSMTCSYSMKKWFGITNVKDNLGLYGATFGNAPATDAHFVVWAGCTNAIGQTVTFQFVIDYLVLLFEPKELPGS